MAQEVFFPPPLRGMISETPYADPRQGIAQLLRNFLVQAGGIRMRPGTEQSRVLSDPGSGQTIYWADELEQDYLFSDGLIRNAAGATLYTSAITNYPPYEGRFRDQVYLSYPGQATARRNGSTWGIFPYTLSTLTSSEIAGSVAYRGRSYFWGTDASDGFEYIEYSGLDEITGNTTTFSINRFMRGQQIIACKSVILEQGLSTGEAFVVYGDDGLVLVYTGDDPEAGNWFLTATYQMTKPQSKLSFTEAQGDVFVMGREYAYSTRALFASGSQAAEATAITKPIQSLFRQATKDNDAYEPSKFTPFCAFYPEYNALIFSPGYAASIMWDFDGSNIYRRLQFVYFRDFNAWVVWDVPQMRWPVGLNSSGQLCWPVKRTIMKMSYANIDSQDEIENYEHIDADTVQTFECVWRSTIGTDPVLRNCRIVGLQPFSRQLEAAQFSSVGVIKEGADFSKNNPTEETKFLQATAVANGFVSVVAHDGEASAADSPVAAPYLDVGIEGSFVHTTLRLQEMSDSTSFPYQLDDESAEIFGMTVHYEPGGPR